MFKQIDMSTDTFSYTFTPNEPVSASWVERMSETLDEVAACHIGDYAATTVTMPVGTLTVWRDEFCKTS